ncbi:MAG: recombination protein RecR [Bdellovibrionales bacterium]|nr:recombination protein RecR [Bdellovibrionales bacterium]
MIHHMPSFEKLVFELARLPGIGPKTAQRLAYHILKSPADYTEALSEAVRQLPEKVRQCPQCFTYTENLDLCHYCSNPERDDSVLCIVEEPGDISRIDSSGAFRGRYHVLHGAISPLDGVEPEDLTIEPLLKRIRMGLNDEAPAIKEVIFALDADLEGDTTVLYLAKILKEKGVKISRIAHGVPIGGDIDYIDNRTLGRALENRISL